MSARPTSKRTKALVAGPYSPIFVGSSFPEFRAEGSRKSAAVGEFLATAKIVRLGDIGPPKGAYASFVA